VEGKFGAANAEEIVVAIAGAGTSDCDESFVVSTMDPELFKVLVGERVGTAGFFGIDGEIFGVNFPRFPVTSLFSVNRDLAREVCGTQTNS